MINILITAVGRGAGQAIIKALRMSGLEARIFATDSDAWATGLYAADQSFLVPACMDESYIENILEICLKENIDLVIPNLDPELIKFAENRHRFQAIGTEVIISGTRVINVCRNKLATFQFFRDRNLPFVETQLVSDILDQGAIEYPLFVKPIGGTGSSEIDVLFCREDLDKYRVRDADRYIGQPYLIPSNWNIERHEIKPEHILRHNAPTQKDEISVQHLVSQKGAIISTFMCRSSLKHGIPVHITPIWDERVYSASRQMVEALIPEGLLGPINLECKITADGPFFYEINPRFTTLSAVRAMLGFNECAAVVGDIMLEQDPEFIRSRLRIDYEGVCSRYVSEIIIRTAAFQQLNDVGELENSVVKCL